MKTAIAYARFSSTNQRDESIDAQLRAIRKFSTEQDIQIIDTFCDHALSGRSDDRPQFKQMIKRTDVGDIDYVIVHKLDRFSRDRYDSAVYKRKLKLNGTKLLSVVENLTDSPESIIMESLLEGMAEYYSANLSREVIKGMKENAYHCWFNGGRIPLGYDIVDKKYVINDMEAKTIRLIFDMFTNGSSQRKIIDTLNENGCKTKLGKNFTRTSLSKILRNDLYKGVYTFNMKKETIKKEHGVPNIITEEQFKLAQQLLQDKEFKSSKKADSPYLLTGILYHYNDKMVGVSGKSKTGRKYYYYKCKNCGFTIPKEQIEEAIIEMLKQVLINEENIDKLVKSKYETLLNKVNVDEVKALVQKVNQLEKEITNITNAIAQGVLSDTLVNKLNTSEKDLEIYKSQLAEKQASTNVQLEDIKAQILAQKQKMDYSPHQLKTIIHSLFERIEYRDDHEVYVELRDVDNSSYNAVFGEPLGLVYELLKVYLQAA